MNISSVCKSNELHETKFQAQQRHSCFVQLQRMYQNAFHGIQYEVPGRICESENIFVTQNVTLSMRLFYEKCCM